MSNIKSEFEELKRFAIADILSVSGRQKTTETVDMHINTIIDIAFLKGQQASQSKVNELKNNINLLNEALDIKEQLNQKLREREDELQKRVDALEKAEFKLAQVKAILQNNPKLLESILVKRIEQAIKGEI